MTRARSSWVPPYMVVAGVAAAFAAACVQVLGITAGEPLTDAGSTTDAGKAPPDAGNPRHDAPTRDVTMQHDAGHDSGHDAAHDALHDVACTTLPDFCARRCGQLLDNCSRPISCGGCDGGASCTQNACGCAPEPASTTCAGRTCGAVKNNCGQIVTCGSGGSTSCESTTDICLASDTCCTPDNMGPCVGKCGVQVMNNCGQTITCPSTCGDGGVCLTNNTCCAADPNWCASRCGSSTNDCLQQVNCGGCDGGLTCTSGSCGCVPQPVATTCAGQVCGSGTNNCGQTVFCGSGGTPNCASGTAVCVSGTCCEPDSLATTCGTACGGVMKTNNCGQTVTCGSCAAGLCVGNACCVPESLATACATIACGPTTDNCGQTEQCPSTCGTTTPCGADDAGVNQCCVDNGMACTGSTCGPATNNCGGTVSCGSCLASQSCVGGACCNVTSAACMVGTDCCSGNCDPVMLVCD